MNVKNLLMASVTVFSASLFAATVNVALNDDLATAIANANDNDELVLAAGTYSLTDQIVISKPITITGAGMDSTIIQQTTANKRLFILDNENAVIRHCKLTGVNANKEINRVGDASNDGNAWGLAVTITANGGTIAYCHVTGNRTSSNHNRCVGVYIIGTKGLISHCRIDDNKTTGGTNNTYGGVRMEGGTMEFCLVTDNLGHQTGGVGVEGAAVISNCTFVANGTRQSIGGNLYLINPAGPAVFKDCVFALGYGLTDNSSPMFPEWNKANTPNTTFNNCSFPTTTPLGTEWRGTPFSADPLFKDTVDYLPRLVSPVKDIGYAPYDASVFECDFTPSARDVFTGTPITLTAAVSGTGNNGLTYTWLITKPDSTTAELSGATPSFTPTLGGNYTVKLTVSDGTNNVEFTETDCFHAAISSANVSNTSELLTALANSGNGTVITCAAGTYDLTDQLTIERGVKIIGADRDTTIIRQTSLKKRVVSVNHADAVVANVTITGGNSGKAGNNTEGLYGMGVYIGSAGGTLTNCCVIGNTNYNNWNHGIGIYMLGEGLVTHCIITNNTRLAGVNQYGGGIYAGNGTIDNCLIAFNSVNNYGGGVYAEANGKIQNCTIAKNTSVAGSGGGVYWVSPSSSSICKNTIIALNASSGTDTSEGTPDWNSNSNPYLQNSSLPSATSIKNLKGDVLHIDPIFVDANAGDFHVMASSTTRDAGIDYAGMPSVDLDGNDRKSGDTAVDLGCYEYDATSFGAAFEGPVDPRGFINVSVQYAGSVSGVDEHTQVTYNWTITSPSAQVSYASTQNIALTPDEYGIWTVSMTATVGSKTSEPYEAQYTVCPLDLYVVPATPENMAKAEVPYASWNTAGTNLIDILRDYALSGCTIHLGEGEICVNKRVELESNISLIGQGREKTTLRQTAQTTSVLYVNDENAVVRGMTLTGLDARSEIHSRGAVIIDAKGGIVEDCRITGNKYANGINQACGVGITINSAKGICRRCLIDRNKGSNGLNNDRGGGVHCVAGLLEDCVVCFNTNKYAGGISVGSGSNTANDFTIRNCTVYGNVGTDIDSGYGQYGVGGLGIFSVNKDKKATIVNTIIWGNTSLNQTWDTGGYPEWRENQTGKVEFINCILPEGVAYPADTATDCVNGDPLFVNAESGDFRLMMNSPCRNTGSDDYYEAGDKDLVGNTRKYGKHVDMGALECMKSTELRLLLK